MREPRPSLLGPPSRASAISCATAVLMSTRSIWRRRFSAYDKALRTKRTRRRCYVALNTLAIRLLGPDERWRRRAYHRVGHAASGSARNRPKRLCSTRADTDTTRERRQYDGAYYRDRSDSAGLASPHVRGVDPEIRPIPWTGRFRKAPMRFSNLTAKSRDLALRHFGRPVGLTSSWTERVAAPRMMPLVRLQPMLSP
jgi:hypothetical protein